MKNIKEYLTKMAEKHPKSVIANLSKGSKVQKSWGLYYEIDDIEIDKNLGEFPKGAVLYGPIYRTLKNSQREIMELFNRDSKISFSKVYNKGLGECLEKSILVQLAVQRGGEGFLINGCFSEENGIGVSPHAYNIVFRNKKPFLVDVQNPLRIDSNNKITNQYIAPILGINEDYGEFLVPEEWKQKRIYSIF